MSKILWRGDAPAVQQITTLTPASVAIGNTFTATMNGKAVTFAATAATVANVVTGLSALLAASTIPEFAEVTWAANGTTNITGTAKTAGVPFTVTASASGGTATHTAATLTANAGPAVASMAANYSGGSLPVNGDDLYFVASSNPCLYDLNALSGVTLNSLTIDQSFQGTTAKVGLPRNNPAGYLEYRPRYLKIGATTITIGGGVGSGAGRILIDTGSVQTVINILGTGAATDAGTKTVLWKGTHASNVVNISQGSFAAAFVQDEVATIATLNQSYQTRPTTDTDVYLGLGCTLTTINKTGGTLVVNSSYATLNHGPDNGKTGSSGTAEVVAGTTGATNLTGGTVYYVTTGTATAITVGATGILDCSLDSNPRTFTNCTIEAGGALKDPGKSITFTNPMSVNCPLADVTLALGPSFNLQRS